MSTRWNRLAAAATRRQMAGLLPSLCYQRPGFSDIEKMTDNISHYFNKLPVSTKPSALPIADTIGFFMETSFHYALYRPIITALQAQGQSCTLVINDRVFKLVLMRCWKH